MTEQLALPVTETSQAAAVRRRAGDLARRIGLDETATGRVSVVASEAASNLAKHARGGELILGASPDTHGAMVRMIALDRGPGIADPSAALRDGVSTAGTPGTGLGAMRRLSSRFDLYSSSEGTVILCDVSASRTRPSGGTGPEVGAVSVPKPGEDVCGDGWGSVCGRERSLVCVADGLGHGQAAAAASRAALGVLHANPGLAPAELLRRMHDALRATRGAAVSIVELDASRRVARFAGIGNVAGTVLCKDGLRHMVAHHGTLGHDVRRIAEFTYPWPEGSTVLLYSDGIATRWALDRYPGLLGRHPAVVASVLYRDFARGRDDTTVVVAREAA